MSAHTPHQMEVVETCQNLISLEPFPPPLRCSGMPSHGGQCQDWTGTPAGKGTGLIQVTTPAAQK